MMKYSLWIMMLLFPTISFAMDVKVHDDPATLVIFWVTFLYFLAMIGRYIAHRIDQPGVLGELFMGLIIGNFFYWLGWPLFILLREGSSIFPIFHYLIEGKTLLSAVTEAVPEPHYASELLMVLQSPEGIDYMKVAYVVDIFARYGIIFLLFKVGLESSIQELRKSGKASLRVAIIGIIAPIILGGLVAYIVSPEASFKSDLFIAATLSATSVGITARVFSELKRLGTKEAKTILGAAVIDDILGLMILAVVSSIVVHGNVDFAMVMSIIAWTVGFFIVVLTLGPLILRICVARFSFLSLWEIKLFTAFIFVMLFSWLATVAGLASIIGAFSAGLIMHDGYFSNHPEEKASSVRISQLIAPLEAILAPLFFILIGIQVKIETFLSSQVLLMAGGLTLAAIIGKLVSGLGASKPVDRLLVGIGMLPRGEVGIVFASMGKALGVISDEVFSSIIVMVMVTTFIAPPLIKLRFSKHK